MTKPRDHPRFVIRHLDIRNWDFEQLDSCSTKRVREKFAATVSGRLGEGLLTQQAPGLPNILHLRRKSLFLSPSNGVDQQFAADP